MRSDLLLFTRESSEKNGASPKVWLPKGFFDIRPIYDTVNRIISAGKAGSRIKDEPQKTPDSKLMWNRVNGKEIYLNGLIIILLKTAVPPSENRVIP
ncbi:hypothetical protein SAMN04488542_11171 [Fontibacillus panacisegetis]|uniref:Uncharacterized protein n=1 Tax=Fontibacillus panacisegetis TaxID=670482 RepID=A0A1G7LBT8_9BACL|nr:hypothetical protein SAMN04488542_11171 [Fontibacillus panacisegetis]